MWIVVSRLDLVDALATGASMIERSIIAQFLLHDLRLRRFECLTFLLLSYAFNTYLVEHISRLSKSLCSISTLHLL